MSIQNYEEQPLSKCCEAPLMTSTGDEGTMCYICRKCNKPSDPKQKKCECCKHELCHFFCGECHNMSCPAFVRPHNKCYDGLMKSIPTESTVTQITIAPSERIDYCSTCKEDHGYECPKDPSPTKPDTEEWKENFKHWHDTFYDETGYFPLNKDFISFFEHVIRQEKEKSYWNGHAKGAKINEDGYNVGRHSAYGEIIKMVEGMNQPIRHSDECLAQTENEKYCDCGLRTYLEGHDSALKCVLSKLKEKLTQK